MKELSIKRNLDESTRKQGVLIGNKTYSLHITHNDEVIITDLREYDKIYSIMSIDIYNEIVKESL